MGTSAPAGATRGAVGPHSLSELQLPSSLAEQLMWWLTLSPEERDVHELDAGGSPGDRTCMRPRGDSGK